MHKEEGYGHEPVSPPSGRIILFNITNHTIKHAGHNAPRKSRVEHGTATDDKAMILKQTGCQLEQRRAKCLLRRQPHVDSAALGCNFVDTSCRYSNGTKQLQYHYTTSRCCDARFWLTGIVERLL